jgi:hypothetical protein
MCPFGSSSIHHQHFKVMCPFGSSSIHHQNFKVMCPFGSSSIHHQHFKVMCPFGSSSIHHQNFKVMCPFGSSSIHNVHSLKRNFIVLCICVIRSKSPYMYLTLDFRRDSFFNNLCVFTF